MLRKHVVSLAALMAVSAMALTACGSTQAGTPAAGGSPSAADDAPVAQNADAGPEGLSLLSGTATANKAEKDTGDWAKGSDGTPNTARREIAIKWVELRAAKAGALNPVLINGAGLTLYRFDNDEAKPSKATCNGDCAKTWPPVLVERGTKVFFAGVKKADIGVVKRDDGTLQLTVGGWPAYRFNKDKKPGDTLGQGVGGTWFGLAPNGQKALGNAGGATRTTPAEPAPNAEKATSAILFDDAEFSDNGASQGIAGRGCQNLGRPNITSSISAGGSLKIWSEKDCKGKSLVLEGGIGNLADVDFDNDIASVFLG
jgi:predicted lipoprotein with Yx(FWY)xxD motif